MPCKYNSENFCTNQDCYNEGTHFCVKSLYGNYCKYYEAAQKKPTPTPDYNQLVANLLTKRDELKSALRETEAELEEIEDFLDALDRFYDQAQDQFKFTKNHFS